jgi:hypothetical protein
VKRNTTEHGLKPKMWQEFGYPRGPLHLHVTNERAETVFEFKISPQWPYVLRQRPIAREDVRSTRKSVDGEQSDTKSAKRERSARKFDTEVKRTGTANSGGVGSPGTPQREAARGEQGEQNQNRNQRGRGRHSQRGLPRIIGFTRFLGFRYGIGYLWGGLSPPSVVGSTAIPSNAYWRINRNLLL